MSIYKPESERFWEKVNKTDSCWVWTAGANSGYGCFYLTGGRKSTPAHRWAYEKIVDTIPEDLVLDHLCRNRLCVNPEHLEPVTHKENILRGEGLAAKEAKQTHCKYGHSLDDAYILSGERRDCRICRKQRNAARTHEYRQAHG